MGKYFVSRKYRTEKREVVVGAEKHVVEIKVYKPIRSRTPWTLHTPDVCREAVKRLANGLEERLLDKLVSKTILDNMGPNWWQYM